MSRLLAVLAVTCLAFTGCARKKSVSAMPASTGGGAMQSKDAAPESEKAKGDKEDADDAKAPAPRDKQKSADPCEGGQ